MKNALQQFDESDCVNLIVDVRENDGGGDDVWCWYCDMLYDHPSKPFLSVGFAIPLKT
ncbi:MAG: hypothetical protein IJS63_07755 [Bacteroidaceae bacterium]|nr:hypothetical protein [Bacteroidaceae bacterium]